MVISTKTRMLSLFTHGLNNNRFLLASLAPLPLPLPLLLLLLLHSLHSLQHAHSLRSAGGVC